jgi:hypothetical protein
MLCLFLVGVDEPGCLAQRLADGISHLSMQQPQPNGARRQPM